jgi:hypothetical protein
MDARLRGDIATLLSEYHGLQAGREPRSVRKAKRALEHGTGMVLRIRHDVSSPLPDDPELPGHPQMPELRKAWAAAGKGRLKEPIRIPSALDDFRQESLDRDLEKARGWREAAGAAATLAKNTAEDFRAASAEAREQGREGSRPKREPHQHALEDASWVSAALNAGVTAWRVDRDLKLVSVVSPDRNAKSALRTEADRFGPGLRFEMRMEEDRVGFLNGHRVYVGATCLPRVEDDDATEGYGTLPEILDVSKRMLLMCPTEAAPFLLARMATEGHDRVFLKGAKAKSGTWSLPLVPGEAPWSISARLHAAMFPFIPARLLVQEHLPMRLERRFFCIDNVPVCSVPVRRKDSVLRWDGVLHDPRHVEHPDDKEWFVDADLAQRFADRAHEIAEVLSRTWPDDGGHYVMDLAMTERGIALIEINTLTNAGQYGASAAPVAKALLEAARRKEQERKEGNLNPQTGAWKPLQMMTFRRG